MIFLPIVDRELREGARRPATYWRRIAVAFLAILIGVTAYLVNYFQPQIKFGTALFWGLSGLSMLFCLFAGRISTADCLSREKREGTMGLLFLTDLKGYDVVFGKLAGTSLGAFYGLLTVFPVMAIPLLEGGMTHGEFWRMVSVLANTFFLSLAVGIVTSAATRRFHAAMAANFFLIALVVGVPAGCGLGLLAGTPPRWVPSLFYVCPVFSFVVCEATMYARFSADFWWSVATTNMLAWIFVFLACLIVPRSWMDKPAVAASGRWRWREIGPLLNFGGPAQRAAFRKTALDANPFFWLAARARLKPAHVWVFVGSAAVWWIRCWIKEGAIWLDEATYIATAMLLNFSFKLWIALEAGQRLGEDRRSGAFEWLLVTPLAVGDILSGQLRALRRQFLRPLLVVAAVELVFVLILARRHNQTAQVHWMLAGILLLAADVAALIWVAMRAALTARSQTRASMEVLIRIFFLPGAAFVGILAVPQVCWLLDLTRQDPGARFNLGLWLGTGLLADAVFGLRAWWSLRRHFREIALRPPFLERRPPRWRQFPAGASAAARWAGRFVAPRFRKPAEVCLAVVLAMAVVLLARGHSKFPPLVVVSLTHTNTPMAIYRCYRYPGEGVLLVLPDGTLWRWGMAGSPPLPRAAVPEQIGGDSRWVKTMGSGAYFVGLRADGTVWEWGSGYSPMPSQDRPALPGNDWIDIAAGYTQVIALRRDGTIWGWKSSSKLHTPSESLDPRYRHWDQVGTARNWTGISCRGGATLGLRSDGTLWTWGQIVGSQIPGQWIATNLPEPVLVCAETNWIRLDADGMARNRAGELWDAGSALPNAAASVNSVCHLASSNWASARIRSASPWIKAEVRSNGTLWASLPDASPPNQELRQIGTRTDWVDLWGTGGTLFGLTSDGTLWVWGYDLGAEPVMTFETRLQILKQRLSGQSWRNIAASTPFIQKPRPLLRMAPGK